MKYINYYNESKSNIKKDILIPRVSKEDRKRNWIRITNLKIQEYIKNGSVGDLDLRGTPITSLPDNLKIVKGNLNLLSSKIVKLPNYLTVNGYLNLSYSNISSLPIGLRVGGKLNISFTKITKISSDIFTGTSSGGTGLNISYTEVSSLPDGLTLDYLYLNYKLINLPNYLTVNGNLNLSSSNILNIPIGLKVGGNLYLSMSKVTSLPDDLIVGGNLIINHKISYPKNLEVGGKIIKTDRYIIL